MSTILHKYNSTPGAVPTAGQMALREIVVNVADGKIYIKNSSGTVLVFRDATAFAAAVHTHAISDVSGLSAALAALAPLASPALTGTPTAPTASGGDNSTKIASTAFVQQEIATLIGAAPTLLNTLVEISTALGDDPNFAATITTSLSGKADLTLSNLSNAGTARTNLGLGSMATQAANAVSITGGSASGLSSVGVNGDVTVRTGDHLNFGAVVVSTPAASGAMLTDTSTIDGGSY